MRELIYYIIAAVGGGIVKEINSDMPPEKSRFRGIITRSFTSVMIGVIFGLTFEVMTGSVKITIAISAMAGVGGLQSIEWLTRLAKSKADPIPPDNPKNDV